MGLWIHDKINLIEVHIRPDCVVDVAAADDRQRGRLEGGQFATLQHRALRHLGADHIDLYQIHWANPSVPLAETCRGLEELKSQGKIRAVGVCNFGLADMTTMADLMPVVTNQLPYSLLWRAIEFEIVPLLLRRNTGILAYSPILHGLLSGKYASADVVPVGIARTRHFANNRPKARHGEDGCEAETFAAIAEIGKVSARAGLSMAQAAIAWVLAQKGVSSVIAGVTKPEQIESNVRAVDITLPDDVVAELARVTETVKDKLGRNVDMWDSKSRIR